MASPVPRLNLQCFFVSKNLPMNLACPKPYWALTREMQLLPIIQSSLLFGPDVNAYYHQNSNLSIEYLI